MKRFTAFTLVFTFGFAACWVLRGGQGIASTPQNHDWSGTIHIFCDEESEKICIEPYCYHVNQKPTIIREKPPGAMWIVSVGNVTVNGVRKVD